VGIGSSGIVEVKCLESFLELGELILEEEQVARCEILEATEDKKVVVAADETPEGRIARGFGLFRLGRVRSFDVTGERSDRVSFGRGSRLIVFLLDVDRWLVLGDLDR
jgi:hypothetical protein